MNREPPSGPPEPSSSSQQFARILLVVALLAAGLWVLREFLPALVWATVFAIALWPLYQRLLQILPGPGQRVLAPLLLTTALAIVFIVPVVLLGFAVARESHFVVAFISTARHHGIPVPEWVPPLPIVGSIAAEWWRNNLSDPETAAALFGRIEPRNIAESAREYGPMIIHRLSIFLFTLLTLFFLFRDGSAVARKLRNLSSHLLGARGELIARHMIAAVHGTVTGLVLVGLAEGLILGVVYSGVGLPYPATFGALTGVAAVIPFAAPVVYGTAGLYLLAAGDTVGGIVIWVAGSVVVFVADHFIRPFLIGGAARLPFLWVLLGLLGGLESFGFLGLLLGPAIMAALIALWRDWAEPPRPDEPARRPTAVRRPAGARASRAPKP